MRTILFVAIVLAGCGSGEPASSGATTEATEATGAGTTPPPPPPPRVPAPTGRSIVRTAEPPVVEGTLPDAALLVEAAMQRAAQCYAQTPTRQGVVAVRMAIAADGSVESVTTPRDELTDETVLTCMREAIARLRVRRPDAAQATSVTATWRFESIHDIDVDRDCIADAECGLVTGLCEGPVAVRRATADRTDRENRERAATVRCAETRIVPSLARCREGYCAAVPADLPELRACESAGDCVAVPRRCGYEAVSVARRAEAEAVFGPEREGLGCEPAEAPAVACVTGFCTADWAGPNAP